MRRIAIAIVAAALAAADVAAQTQLPRNIRPPRLVTRVDPAYPREAMRERIQGLVLLEIIIEPDGSVSTLKVLQSLDPRLDAAAMEAVKQWTYEPALVDGKPVRMVAKVNVSFSLRGGVQPRRDWPEGFSAAPGVTAPERAWITDSAIASGLEISVSFPGGWTIQKDPSSLTEVLTVRDAGLVRRMAVLFPRPSIATLDKELPIAELLRFADAIAKTTALTTGGPFEARAVGQVAASNGGFWLWHETEVPTHPLVQGLVVAQDFESTHLWMFTATVGKQMVVIACSVMLPRALAPAEKQERILQAAGDFGEMVRRISIREAP